MPIVRPMLELKDIYHLPQVGPVVDRLAVDGPGLVVVAGLDPHLAIDRAAPGAGSAVLPSGRSAIFRILLWQILAAKRGTHAVVVAESEDAIRLPRQFRHRVSLSVVDARQSYRQAVEVAVRRRPDVLVVDRLSPETLPAMIQAAERGLRVLTQLNTIFRGSGVVRQMRDLGAGAEHLAALTWVVSVLRLPTLCSNCKHPSPPQPRELERLAQRYPDLDAASVPGVDDPPAGYCRASGCAECGLTGRRGEVTAFDLFRSDPAAANPLEQPSLLSLESYLLGLAARGMLPLDDVLDLDAELVRRTYGLLAASQSALAEASTALERKAAELQAANQVLERHTQALISLQGVGHALITSTGLDDLAARLCRNASDLCGADRAIMYFLRPDGVTAEILAAIGWDPVPIRQPMPAEMILAEGGTGPVPASHWPPGVPRRATDATSSSLRAGLRVPLVAMGRQVGLMIVHTSRRAHFPPGDVSLLQTFADQAALAVQRTGLIEDLRDKINQLEAAQTELVKKERMERELELAREVQQSVLPRIFPLVPGYRFAARSQPARQVGGDFYDVVLIDADRFGVVVGDVSDKGLPAALYMALARSLILAESRRGASPREVLASVHHLLLELGQPHMFVTVFYGVIDGAARRLTYCRAGHDRPLLLHGDGARFLGGDGTLLGFPEMAEVHLTEEQEDLAAGDRLVLYTDGLADARSPDGRMFGLERLTTVLQAHRDLPPDDLCNAILAEVGAHEGQAEQFDDMTLLIVDVCS